jgi:hypothetical protein
VPFKGLVGPEPLLFLSFYFSAIRWMAFLHCALPVTMYCLATSLKTTEPTGHGLEPPKLWAQNSPFLFASWLSQAFYYSNRKLANTPDNYLEKSSVHIYSLKTFVVTWKNAKMMPQVCRSCTRGCIWCLYDGSICDFSALWWC